MTREQLVEIYKDTKERCSEFQIPKSEKVKGIHSAQEFKSKAGKIIVEPLDTVSALAKYVNEGKTAVLNMANAKHKGGGVERGAMAQEECLFRCSNLFTISDELYPMASDELIYTHQAVFVKSADYGTIWPMDADVITIAAPNLNKEHFSGGAKDKYDSECDSADLYEAVMKTKIEMMLTHAAANNCDNIILGAWGCGVFKNDPKVVSALFKEALLTKNVLFDKIIFAVINDRNSVANNFQIFADTFKDGVQA